MPHPTRLPAPRLRELIVSLSMALALLMAGLGSGPLGVPTIEAATGAIKLPAGLTPSLANAKNDVERLAKDHCLGYEHVTVPATCIYGNKSGAYKIALVGDSHAAHWFPALEAIAKARGWKLVVFVKVSCGFLDMRVRNLALGREYRECATWNANVLKSLAALRPNLTLVGMSRIAIHPVLSSDNTVARKGAAIARMIAKVPGRVALIVDTPYAGKDIPACLAAHRSDIRACYIAKSTALTQSLGAMERAAVRITGDGLIDMTSSICPRWSCPVVIGKIITFRDQAHLTATFARSLSGVMAAKIDQVR